MTLNPSLSRNTVDKAKSSLSESTSMILRDKSLFYQQTSQNLAGKLSSNIPSTSQDSQLTTRRTAKRYAVPRNEPLLVKDLSSNLHLSVALPVPHAFLPSIPEVLRHLVPSVTSAIGYPIIVHPTFRQGLVIVSTASGLAIGGTNALKSPDLFLKVFQVTDYKTVTNKVSLNFHLLLPRVISLKIYQRIPFKNLRALSLSWRSQL